MKNLISAAPLIRVNTVTYKLCLSFFAVYVTINVAFFFLQDPVFSLDCNRTSMKLSGRKNLIKMNWNGVKGVRGHAPLENFECPSSHKFHFLHSELAPLQACHKQHHKHRGRFRWTRNEFSKANPPFPGRPSAKPHHGEGDVKKCPTNTRGEAQAWNWKDLLLCELLLEPCVRTSSSLD